MRRPDPIRLEETLPLFPLVLPMGYFIVKRLLALVLAAWIPPMRSRPANAAHENLARDVGESEKGEADKHGGNEPRHVALPSGGSTYEASLCR